MTAPFAAILLTVPESRCSESVRREIYFKAILDFWKMKELQIDPFFPSDTRHSENFIEKRNGLRNPVKLKSFSFLAQSMRDQNFIFHGVAKIRKL